MESVGNWVGDKSSVGCDPVGYIVGEVASNGASAVGYIVGSRNGVGADVSTGDAIVGYIVGCPSDGYAVGTPLSSLSGVVTSI